MSDAKTLTAEEIDDHRESVAYWLFEPGNPAEAKLADIADQAKRVPELERACDLARDLIRREWVTFEGGELRAILAALAAVGMPVEK
jgi:hypothetical protein